MATVNNQHILYREMLLDLCYRLRLADDIFCRVAEALTAAMAVDDFSLKAAAIAALRDYAASLRIVYADYRRVCVVQCVVFPPEPCGWQWDEPDADAALPLLLERLQGVAQGMETHLYRVVSGLEGRP